MSHFHRPLLAAVAALCIAATAGCESSGSGGSVSYSGYYGGAYYPGGYYPGYYPGYPCCYDGDDIVINPPDRPGGGNGPDRPTTLPAHPEQLPADRPSQATARPAPSSRPTPSASARPAPRPTPRPMGGGGRRR
jgi:hypothetical protein